MSDSNIQTGRRRVLLVEDNDNDVELTKMAFAAVDPSIELRCVGDGEQCMAALHESRAGDLPDLILLDLHMPRMDGLELLTALKSDAAFKTIPAIVLTTSDAPEDVDAAYRAGCASYLRKPLGFNAFIQLVETLTRFWFAASTLPSRQPVETAAATEPDKDGIKN